MRLLGSNLLPFSVAQLPGTWSTGIEVEAYFFEGTIPSDLSQYFLDHRKLIADCVCASRIVLQPTVEGLLMLQQYTHGIKAVPGSVYDPKLGVTIHYPKNIIPRRTTASATAFDIDAAYATDLLTGNKKMKLHPSIGLFPGFPVSAAMQLTDYVGTMAAQTATVADLVFDSLITFDAVLADSPNKNAAASLQIITASTTSGATPSGTTVNLSVPANLATNAAPSAMTTDILRAVGNSSVRRCLPVSIGNKATAKVTKNIGYAILLITDSNSGALAAGNADIRMIAVKVGAKGSGELIELESLAVSTGEFPEVLQVRTAKTLSTASVLPTWIDPNARLAFSGDNFTASPATDYLGNKVTYTGWPKQSDGSVKGTYGSSMNFPISLDIDFSKSFYMEFDYRQDDTSSNAELDLVNIHTTFTDRFILALDRSNETGLCLWNNQQGTKVARPFSYYTGLRTTSFVRVVYQYDADTSTHKFSINGTVVDSFVYKVLPYTKQPVQILGTYGGAALPVAYLRNFQMVQGKKVDLLGSGVYEVLDLKTGETNNAYINNSDGGGAWMLIAAWQAINGNIRNFNQLMQKGFTVLPNDELLDPLFPCYPKTFMNNSEEWMFTSDRVGWVNLYGSYMYGKTFASGDINIGAGVPVPVTTPLGAKNVYGRQSGWSGATPLNSNFGLWTHPNNTGPCGGSNVVGSDKICPCAGNWGSPENHCDSTGTKRLYLRINSSDFKLIRKL